jgi:hypothetical protein
MRIMPESESISLPPLILHPFATPADAPMLLDATRANLMRHSLIPRTLDSDTIPDAVLRGRYCEMRWLYYIGRDIARWISQCLDFSVAHDELSGPRVNYQAFAAFLTENPPAPVKEKLLKWGVFDFRRVFARALGLNSVFSEFPSVGMITEEFVREYYSYSDTIFTCRQRLQSYLPLDPRKHHFEIYTSAEYMKILEQDFGGN